MIYRASSRTARAVYKDQSSNKCIESWGGAAVGVPEVICRVD